MKRGPEFLPPTLRPLEAYKSLYNLYQWPRAWGASLPQYQPLSGEPGRKFQGSGPDVRVNLHNTRVQAKEPCLTLGEEM